MRCLLISILAVGLASASFAALEFTGYMRSKDTLQFFVTDLSSGATSGWLTIGSVFEDHKIAAFEVPEEVLVLEHNGQSIRLTLKEPRVRNGKSPEHERIELHLRISPDGVLVLDGQAIHFDAFEELLRKYGEKNTHVALIFRGPWPPSAKIHETLQMVLRAIPKSGAKKFSIILD